MTEFSHALVSNVEALILVAYECARAEYPIDTACHGDNSGHLPVLRDVSAAKSGSLPIVSHFGRRKTPQITATEISNETDRKPVAPTSASA